MGFECVKPVMWGLFYYGTLQTVESCKSHCKRYAEEETQFKWEELSDDWTIKKLSIKIED